MYKQTEMKQDTELHQKINLFQRIEKMYRKELEVREPSRKPIVEKWICETNTKIHSLKAKKYAYDYES